MTVRVIVTGDRDWTNHLIIYNVLHGVVEHNKSLGNITIVTHGAASGADSISSWAVKDLKMYYKVFEDSHPAKWYGVGINGESYFNKGAGPQRND